MVTLVGVMSPTAFPATSAYGTLRICCRGVISASVPTVTPRYSACPVNVLGGIAPSTAEKNPSSSVTFCDSDQIAVPPVGVVYSAKEIVIDPATGFPFESSSCPCSVRDCGTCAIALPADSAARTIAAPVVRLTLPTMKSSLEFETAR